MTQEKNPVVMELLEVRKSYPGNPPVEALRGINLVVRRGELLALVGTSGSGKSTMLNLIGGADRPTSGHIWFGDVDLGSLSDDELTAFRRESVGFIFQFYNLIPSLTAAENVQVGQAFVQGRRQPHRILHYALLIHARILQRHAWCHRVDRHSFLSGCIIIFRNVSAVTRFVRHNALPRYSPNWLKNSPSARNSSSRALRRRQARPIVR